MRFASFFSTSKLAWVFCVAVSLASCSSGLDKHKPAELGPNPGLLGVRQAWVRSIGTVEFPLQVRANGNALTLAASDGLVASLDAATGAEIWRVQLDDQIAAGVGSDGRFSAVVTRTNELVALDGGREAWRAKLPAQGFTAPLVAGARIFVLTADRAVTAFDAQSGRKLWVQQRPGDPLVLRQSGVLLAINDTLVVGMSGRLIGLSPLTGAIRWDVPVAQSRGTNDIERLVDLVGQVFRDGDVVCVRAFQSAVGCVNAERGQLIWTKPANGFAGLHGDGKNVYGIEADGRLIAWRQTDGERAWLFEGLRYRNLTAAVVVGRSIVVGEDSGVVHFLSREDGTVLTRLDTDASPIAAVPVLVGGTLVVVTQRGGVFGFKPE